MIWSYHLYRFNKDFVFKSFLTRPSNIFTLNLKQTFPPMIWIFTEGEGDGIESRIPFKIFSTLRETNLNFQVQFQILELHFFVFFAISWCGCRNGCPCLSFWHCLRKFRVDIWLRFCGLAHFNFWKQCCLDQNLYWKLGQQSTICWNSLGLLRDYGLNHIFFRNKTFLFFKIESWNFQHLFEKKFMKSHNISTQLDNR